MLDVMYRFLAMCSRCLTGLAMPARTQGLTRRIVLKLSCKGLPEIQIMYRTQPNYLENTSARVMICCGSLAGSMSRMKGDHVAGHSTSVFLIDLYVFTKVDVKKLHVLKNQDPASAPLEPELPLVGALSCSFDASFISKNRKALAPSGCDLGAEHGCQTITSIIVRYI